MWTRWMMIDHLESIKGDKGWIESAGRQDLHRECLKLSLSRHTHAPTRVHAIHIRIRVEYVLWCSLHRGGLGPDTQARPGAGLVGVGCLLGCCGGWGV